MKTLLRRTPLGLAIVLFLATVASAQEEAVIDCRRSLDPGQIEVVRESKELIRDIDTESLDETVQGLNKTSCPVMQVLMLSAMARTYADLVVEYELDGLDARQRLYDKIGMNMAFMQFTAGRGSDEADLNRLIRLKLKQYLPPEILTHPGFYFSLEE